MAVRDVFAIVTTRVIDVNGRIDPETAIPHEGVSTDPREAIEEAHKQAADYIATQFESMGTDTFDIQVEIREGLEVRT